jgi:hypothetical protein
MKDFHKFRNSLNENKNLVKDYQELKAKGKLDRAIIDILMSQPKYRHLSADQMGKIIGDAKRKGTLKR